MKAFFTGGQGEDIDLGAKQCMKFHSYTLFCTSDACYPGILVRNDATKARLEEKFPILGRNNFMLVLGFLSRSLL